LFARYLVPISLQEHRSRGPSFATIRTEDTDERSESAFVPVTMEWPPLSAYGAGNKRR